MPQAAVFDFPNAATPAGSAAYYLARFAPQPQRDDLARLFAWRDEIQRIVVKANDPGVARLKLDWWRTELERCAADEARHPLAQALTGLAQTAPVLEAFQQVLATAELEVLRRQPETEAELRQRLDRSGGAFAELTLHAGGLGAVDRQTREAARRLGTLDAAVQMLRDLQMSLQRDYCPLPAAALAEHELRPLRPGEPGDQARVGRLGRELVERLQEETKQHSQSPAGSELRTARRLAAVAMALHRKMARLGYPLLRERVELSPIANLWVVWRQR